MKIYFNEISLFAGHSLRHGNIEPLDAPDGPSLETLQKVIAKPDDIRSFGLFSSADFHKFHPDGDAKPKVDDYVRPLFRALSKVVVHKKYNPVDFSMNDALKDSMPLLKGQSVKGDHDTGIGTTLGAVEDVAWEEAYEAEGITVPAGINSKLKLDTKVNPAIARLVQMDPPGIHSTSVTVGFNWEQSHPSMDRNEFINKIGTFGADGKLVRRIVNEVKYYTEISLVDHGADGYAKKIGKDGKIYLPQMGVITNSAEREKQKYFFFDFKPGYEDVISNSENSTIPTESISETSNSKVMKEQLIALAAIFGLTYDENKPETGQAILEAVKKLMTDKTALDGQVANVATLTADKTSLQTFKDTILGVARGKAIASLQKAYDNKAPEALITVINNTSDITAIEALQASYDGQTEAKYPLSCKKCGSTNVSRGSAVTQNEAGKGESTETQQAATKTEEQIREGLLANKGSFVSLHDEVEEVKK